MSETDYIGIGFIAGSALGLLIAELIHREWKAQCVKRGHAEYSTTTGRWQWKGGEVRDELSEASRKMFEIGLQQAYDGKLVDGPDLDADAAELMTDNHWQSMLDTIERQRDELAEEVRRLRSALGMKDGEKLVSGENGNYLIETPGGDRRRYGITADEYDELARLRRLEHDKEWREVLEVSYP